MRVGLAVVFAALGDEEGAAIRQAWNAAAAEATAWRPAFSAFGVRRLSPAAPPDLLVYLGESSRFEGTAGRLARRGPVLLIKSTLPHLLRRPAATAPRRYRMCTDVAGIATALALAAPRVPTVDWTTLPWPGALGAVTELEEAEARYAAASIGAFRRAAWQRGIAWRRGLPPARRRFSVFLTMHDPLAARLASAALRAWPQCTVIAADGMVAARQPDGRAWPERLIRVRHWSARLRTRAASTSSRAGQIAGIPDFDSAGMLIGALRAVDAAVARGFAASELHRAGSLPGPLGPFQFTRAGRPRPERVVIVRGAVPRVVEIQGQGQGQRQGRGQA